MTTQRGALACSAPPLTIPPRTLCLGRRRLLKSVCFQLAQWLHLQRGVSRSSSSIAASPNRTPRGVGGVSRLSGGGGGDHMYVRMQTWLVQELADGGSLQVRAGVHRFFSAWTKRMQQIWVTCDFL